MLRRLEVGERLDRRGVPIDHQVEIASRAAEPIELGGVELRLLAVRREDVQQTLERDDVLGRADRAAVLGCDVGHIVGHGQAGGSDHVFRNDRGIAGNMAAKAAADDSGIEIVTAAGVRADVHRDLLIAVEIGNRIGTA